VRSWRERAKIGRPELIREVISAVRPDSVIEMIAVTPFRWLAAYIADMAIASSTLSN